MRPRKKLNLPIHDMLVANYRRIAAHLRMSGTPISQRQLYDLQLMKAMKIKSSEFTRGLADILKSFKLNGSPRWFTRVGWEDEYEDVTRLRERRRCSRARETFPLGHPNYIYLSKYNELVAGKFWARKGCPRFQKRIISGVVFGHGIIDDNGKTWKAHKIYTRHIGVVVAKNPLNDHIGLTFSIPG